MAMHKELSRRADNAMYLCALHCPWRLGSNENASTCPRAPTFRATARSSQCHADQIKNWPRKEAWAYDHLRLSMATPSQQPATFHPPSLRLRVSHFTLESTPSKLLTFRRIPRPNPHQARVAPRDRRPDWACI